MGTRVGTRIAAVAVALLAIPAAGASAQGTDYAATALNIMPSGQYGSVPPPRAPTPRRRCTTA